MPPTSEETSHIPPALAQAMDELRQSLESLISSVQGDSRKPQQLSRQLGLDKTLAWKVSRLINAQSPSVAFQYLPGDAAIDLLLEAVRNAGGDPKTLESVTATNARFRASVKHYIGDRSTLDIVVDGLPTQGVDRLANSRKLAFRGNSGIWGVQAKARTQSVFVFPSASDPGRVDVCMVVGWFDFRRMRRDAKWVLFRHSLYSHEAGGRATLKPEALDHDHPTGDGLALLRGFCSPTLPTIDASEDAGHVAYHIGESPVGNAGAFTCMMGSIYRSMAQRYGDPLTEGLTFAANITAPVESLLFDIFIHQDLRTPDRPEVALHGALSGGGRISLPDNIPLGAGVRQLSGKPVHADTSLFPRYAELLNLVYTRTNQDPAAFIAYRYELDYPPFPSTALMGIPVSGRE